MKKAVYSILFVFSALGNSTDGWVQVPRQEKVLQETEEDHSIWVVFAKAFGSERVLVRFPEDPLTHQWDEFFQATAADTEGGELSLVVQKKDNLSSEPCTKATDFSYRDEVSGLWVQERWIETEGHIYLLRATHPSESAIFFSSFFDSFELEREEDFKRA